jgi:benzodiazapine receptor
MSSSRRNSIKFILSVAFAALAGGLGALASAEAAVFYAQLLRPSWAPPAYVFGPVWTMLYLMMAVSAWQVWRKQYDWRLGLPLLLYLVQLGINALWSWLFFAWHLGAWALVDVLLLWIMITATMNAFRTISKIATWLLLPYWVWVGFATVLTAWIWQHNSELLG